MGNVGSSSSGRRSNPPAPASHPPQPEIRANNIVFAAASPYPTRFPHPPSGYYQYRPPAGYCPPHPGPGPMRTPFPAPYDHHHQLNWAGPGAGRSPFVPPPPPYVEHQKAVTIRNDVNLEKGTLRVEPDEENPGKYLVSFTFDATVPGSLSVIYFAKEGEECQLTPTKENLLPQVTVQFEQGLGQKFRQPSGTGIDFSIFEESELMKVNMDVCPLAVKAYACPPPKQSDMGSDDSPLSEFRQHKHKLSDNSSSI